MIVIIVDSRDENRTLFEGDLEVVPNLGDLVALKYGDNNHIAMWEVEGRTFMLGGNGAVAVVLQIGPHNRKSWDGSADEMVQVMFS